MATCCRLNTAIQCPSERSTHGVQKKKTVRYRNIRLNCYLCVSGTLKKKNTATTTTKITF